MRWFALIIFLAGCNTPSPGFYGTQSVTRDLGGHRFLVRVKADQAEVTRTSAQWRPELSHIQGLATKAAQEVSGCKVAWIEGDVALMVVGLSCNGAPAPPKPKRKKSIYCDIMRGGGAIDCSLY